MAFVRFLRGIVLLILAPIITIVGYFIIIFWMMPTFFLGQMLSPQILLIYLVADVLIGIIIFGTGIYFIFTDSKKGEDVRIAVKKEPHIEEHKVITETKSLKHTEPQTHAGEDHIKVLKLRYAKGEITKREFEEMKKTLSD